MELILFAIALLFAIAVLLTLPFIFLKDLIHLMLHKICPYCKKTIDKQTIICPNCQKEQPAKASFKQKIYILFFHVVKMIFCFILFALIIGFAMRVFLYSHST